MTRKQWAVLALTLLAGALSAIVGAVVLVDPFQVYRKATAFIPPIDNGTQIYSNAGIAKSYDYDSVLIGSSMTENFRPSQLDSLFGGRFVKIPVNAGSPYNHKQMMDMAFSTHDVRRVLYGVDIELFTYFYTTPKCEMPDYLYDEHIFNDVRYWFNQSVLAEFIPKCLRTWGQTDEDQRDTMYTWGSMYPYGRDAVLRDFAFTGPKAGQEPIAGEDEAAAMSQQTMLNVAHNIVPFIQSHPDTQFIFFFPPYSLARWVEFDQLGDMHYHMNQKEAVARALLEHDNVRVFDFQANTDWILDLDNYIDTGHYGPWINDAMAQAMAAGQFEITDPAQIKQNNAVIRDYVTHVHGAGGWPDVFPESTK